VKILETAVVGGASALIGLDKLSELPSESEVPMDRLSFVS
jgi:hypothetical protein